MSGYGILDYEGMNQAIYRGATSNIVVDTQKMGIGIGVDQNGPSSNLHVVGNTRLEGDINMIHTSNTSSMKVNSNVVTEFPRSKKLIRYPRVALNADSQDGYVVTVSSEVNTTSWQSYNAFDNNTTDGSIYNWASQSGKYTNSGQTYSGGSSLGNYDGEYIQIELPVKINLSLVRIFPRTHATPSPQTPKDFVIIASNDGVTYDLLKSVTNQSDSGTWINIDIHTTNLYNRFALVISKTISDGIVALAEIEYHGVPEYDPDAAGVDTKMTSYPNVPNTDWLEVYYDAKESSSYPGTGGTVLDLSGNGNNGTLNGDVGFDSEYKAFTFDGNGDYIKTTLTGFTGTTVTFSAWVFIDSIDTSRVNTIMGLGSWGSTGSAAWIAVGSSGTLETGNKGITSCGGSVQATALTKRWLHITGIVSSGDFRFYQDGQLLKSLTTTGTINYGTDPVLYLATRANSSGDPEATRYLDCKIANARLFNRALSSDEVWQLYSYQKEYFGHGDLSMTLKAGRLGIGTSEPRAALDVRGDVHISGNLRKTRARMIRLESGSVGPTTQAGWQTYVSYGETWTAYSSNPLYSVSITGDFVGVGRAITYRIAVQNQRTGEVVYFPSSSGWTKYHYYDHTRLDGHGYLGIMSGLIPGDSYKVQLEVDPKNTNTAYEWKAVYGTITGLVWD
jgi:hypothetical protein